jgi:dynein heavy chain
MTIFSATLQSPLIRQYSKSIVDATIYLYRRISSELLPTPTKAHYTFNLRDLSKVFQGILGVAPNCILLIFWNCLTFTSTDIVRKDQLLRLWLHECQRTFGDRLVNDQDRFHFFRLLDAASRSHFNDEEFQRVDVLQVAPRLLFGSFAGDLSQRAYKDIDPDSEHVKKALAEILEDYSLFSPMGGSRTNQQLILFDYAVQHIARICRIVSQVQYLFWKITKPNDSAFGARFVDRASWKWTRKFDKTVRLHVRMYSFPSGHQTDIWGGRMERGNEETGTKNWC